MLRRCFVLAAVASMAVWSGAGAEDKKGEKQGGDTHEGKVVKVEGGKLTMTGKDGKKEHTHAIGADTKVTVDGKEGKLEDLKPGFTIKVTVDKKGDKETVTRIEARKDDKGKEKP